MKCCVNSAGKLSEFCKNSIGPLQGKVLSPILFSLYVNDFEIEFLRSPNVPIHTSYARIKPFCFNVCR